MNQIVWGLLSAFSLGTADFLAGLNGRTLGYSRTLLWVFVVSCICLTAYMLAVDHPMVIALPDQWLIVMFGLLNTIAMLLLYGALAIGPLSLVAPIISAYPVIVVAFAFLLGSRPSELQWLGMTLATVGVIVVAAAVRSEHTSTSRSKQHGKVLMLASCACLAYAILVITGQHAVPVHGELQTLWLGRIVALIALLPFLLISRTSPGVQIKWWPILCLQGILDFAGVQFLLLGSNGDYTEFTAVVGSLFGAVTVRLAWVILKEHMSKFQWMGIFLIFTGVASLSAAS